MERLYVPFVVIAVLLFAVALYLFACHGKGTTWKSRGTLLVCGLICLGLGWFVQISAVFGRHGRFTQWLLGFFYDSSAFPAIQSEWEYEYAEAEYLGRYLGEKRSGKRCVIVSAPLLRGQDGRPSANPMIDGLLAGMDGHLEVVKTVFVPMEAPKSEIILKGESASEMSEASVTATSEEELSAGDAESEKEPNPLAGPLVLRQSGWTVEALKKLLSDVGEYDILVTCLPLPSGTLTASGACSVPELSGKELVFAGGYDGFVQVGIDRGTVLAALAYRDDAEYDTERSGKQEEMFNKRFALVTSDGVTGTQQQEN